MLSVHLSIATILSTLCALPATAADTWSTHPRPTQARPTARARPPLPHPRRWSCNRHRRPPPVPFSPPSPLPEPPSETLVSARRPISAASSFVGPRSRLPAPPDRQRARHPPRHARARARAALGRRQGEPVLPARLRRRPRHRPRAVDRRHSDQHGLARPRPGLHRHRTSSSPRWSSAWRSRRARTSRTRAISRPPARSTWSRATTSSTARSASALAARPATASPAIAGSHRQPEVRDGIKATFAAEIGRQNGPFDNPENWDKYKLFNKVTYALNAGVVAHHRRDELRRRLARLGADPRARRRAGRSRASDRSIPTRAATPRGTSSRSSTSCARRETSEITALAYVGAYRFNLFSNFTLYLRDPENGDEIQQVDRRTFYGGKLSYRVVHEIGGVRFDTTIGGDARSDDIHESSGTRAARQLERCATTTCTRRRSAPSSTRRSRRELAARRRRRPRRHARRSRSTTSSPSARSAAPRERRRRGAPVQPEGEPRRHAARPAARSSMSTSNYGHGFHSNDVRGVVRERRAVTPLTRAIGSEVGSRARLFDRWDVAAALWQLDLDNETVWNGDKGTTEVGDATTRTASSSRRASRSQVARGGRRHHVHQIAVQRRRRKRRRARARAEADVVGRPLGAARVGPGVARGGLRFYGIGDRPASDDGELVAPGFTHFDLHLGYRIAGSTSRSTSRTCSNGTFALGAVRDDQPPPHRAGVGGPSRRLQLRFERAPRAHPASVPAGRFSGCEDVHFTPQYPLTLRVMATVYLD